MARWQEAMAAVIKAERDKRGWSQKDLAERAGVSTETVSIYENARRQRPMRAQVKAIEAAFPLTPGTLLGLKDAVYEQGKGSAEDALDVLLRDPRTTPEDRRWLEELLRRVIEGRAGSNPTVFGG